MVVGDAMFYLALPPGLFGQAVSALGAAGLADEVSGARRLVIEKPFGTSSATAAELQSRLAAYWHEDQILRIDHFLGKEPPRGWRKLWGRQVGDAAVPR